MPPEKEIYPPGPLIFNALNSTPLNNIKVVILGQDPYHGRPGAWFVFLGSAGYRSAAIAGQYL
jgi:uracil DNA glycosylase